MKGFSVDGCVENWILGGAPKSKINIGLPFYGRSFLKSKGLNEPHDGNDKNTWFWDDGSPQFFNIVKKLPELVSVRHEPTKTQYAYKDSNMGGLVSYDDEEAICDKTEYCIDHELNGFIIWVSIRPQRCNNLFFQQHAYKLDTYCLDSIYVNQGALG